MSKRRLWILLYDISDAKRLRQVLALAKNYRSGGQYSVHECWLLPTELTKLKQQLKAIIDARHDRCLLLPVRQRAMPAVLTF